MIRPDDEMPMRMMPTGPSRGDDMGTAAASAMDRLVRAGMGPQRMMAMMNQGNPDQSPKTLAEMLNLMLAMQQEET